MTLAGDEGLRYSKNNWFEEESIEWWEISNKALYSSPVIGPTYNMSAHLIAKFFGRSHSMVLHSKICFVTLMKAPFENAFER